MNYFSQISFLSLSELYTWMNQLSSEASVIECGQLHRGQFLVLVRSAAPLEKPRAACDFFSTNKSADMLIRAYYKQNSIPLMSGLLILEADLLSSLFSCISNDPQLVNAPLLEVSRSALPEGKAAAIFVNVSDINTKVFPQEIHATYFAQTNSHLRSLFDF
jgi:hypothetical protein